MKHPKSKHAAKAATESRKATMRSPKASRAKSAPIQDLPIDSSNADGADRVVGGGGKPKPVDTPKDGISLNFSHINFEY